MKRQSGRQDGKPQPTGDRLPHTRIAKVRRIELTMEIRHRDSQDSDVFTFETDVYSDQDRNNHLLLITQDSTVSDTELEDIAYLHNPQLPHDIPRKVRDALDESLSDTYQTYLVDQLRNGPEHAALSLLGRVTAALDTLGLNDSQETTPATIDATSSSGKVRITLNPPRGTPFYMPDPPVNFIQADLQHLPDDATVLFLPTEEPPGAIRPGHVLIYSPYDGKLQTFQPRDTHFTHRVHPFTIRPPELTEPPDRPGDSRHRLARRGCRADLSAPSRRRPTGLTLNRSHGHMHMSIRRQAPMKKVPYSHRAAPYTWSHSAADLEILPNGSPPSRRTHHSHSSNLELTATPIYNISSQGIPPHPRGCTRIMIFMIRHR